MASDSTQISAASALVQLLTEHPELSRFISWSISRSKPRLYGFAHEGGYELLTQCAAIVGGSVEADGEYKQSGRTMQQFAVRSVWRDVPVEVAVALPVAAEAVKAA